LKIKKKLGEMLVEARLVTDTQLKKALSDIEKLKIKIKLGQFLIKEGIVNEKDIVNVISDQLKIKKYNSAIHNVNTDISKLIPANLAKKYQIVPLFKKGFLLTVAMLDPMDINALDSIEVHTNIEIEPIICTENELNTLTGLLYGTYSSLDGVLEDIEDMNYSTSGEDQNKSSKDDDVQVSSLQDMAEQAPIIRFVNSILSQAVKDMASDVHICPEKDYVQVRFRVDGKLHDVPAPQKAIFLPFVSRIKILAQLDIASSRIPQDGRFTISMKNKEINVRVSTLPTIYGENIVLRLLDTSEGIYSLERLGMSQEDMKKIEQVIRKPYGMILSTGPTGSGKSTSLYSILKEINTPDINIITLEDPVEFRVEKIRQVQLNKKAGMTFASGLRAILRQDPDVIMIGEIRDKETATIAVQAALTGHRVFSTVHTNEAAGAIVRFMDMGIEPFLVSSVLLLSFAQRLIRKICPQCKEPYEPSAQVLEYWGMDKEKKIDFVRGHGCINCMKTGFKGRTGIFEVLLVDEMVKKMILERKSANDITRTASKNKMFTTLKHDAADKIKRGITTIEEASSAVMS